MLPCRACVRHLYEALLLTHPPCPPRLVSQQATRSFIATPRSNRADDAPPSQKYRQRRDGEAAERPARRTPPHQSMTNSKLSQVASNAAHDAKAQRSKAMRALKKELEYLQDPLKLADRVKYLLETSEDTEKALALVRLTNQSKLYVVSWNHIIDWQLKHGKVKQAFSTYNEMKKRNQRPDNYTYTILLRGLADNVDTPTTLGRALAVYHSIRAPHSKITHSLYHTNAVLKVCARANDMDSLWDIVGQLPDQGNLAADALTFTIIFNALRIQAMTPPLGGETPSDAARRRERAIKDGRQIWATILQRWSRADLPIDEGMVNAMGRLLLIGDRPRDWDDVLSLVHQTMNIPRLTPRLGTAIKIPTTDPQGPSLPQPEQESPSGSVVAIDQENGQEATDPDMDIFNANVTAKAAFEQPLHKRGVQFRAFASPGNSTVSLVAEACLKLGAPSTALDYFRLLTDRDGHGIRPDLDNFIMVLRNFRQARQAEAAAELVQDMSKRYKLRPSAKTYRVAMEACVRDQDPGKALKSAEKLLEMILNAGFQRPELTALRQYLEVVQKSSDVDAMVNAIKRLNAEIVDLRSVLGIRKDKDGNVETENQPEPTNAIRHEAVEFLGTLKTTYEKVIETGSALRTGRVRKEELIRRKDKIADYIKRIQDDSHKENVAARIAEETKTSVKESKSRSAELQKEWSTKRREIDLDRLRAKATN